MTRLVAFGCSYTYGSHLNDCPPDSLQPSSFSWPALAAEKLGIAVINCSKPGSSNLEILHTILNFNFKKDDVVVVLWSMFSRGTIFDKGKMIRYGIWLPEYSKWLGAQTENHLIMMSWLYMHHAESYLQNLNLKNYSYIVEQSIMIEHKPSFINLTNLKDVKSIFNKMPDYGNDKLHPGKITHELFSEIVYEDLNFEHC